MINPPIAHTLVSSLNAPTRLTINAPGVPASTVSPPRTFRGFPHPGLKRAISKRTAQGAKDMANPIFPRVAAFSSVEASSGTAEPGPSSVGSSISLSPRRRSTWYFYSCRSYLPELAPAAQEHSDLLEGPAKKKLACSDSPRHSCLQLPRKEIRRSEGCFRSANGTYVIHERSPVGSELHFHRLAGGFNRTERRLDLDAGFLAGSTGGYSP